ncbi:MAG: hypothetical protein J6W64_08380 [Bacilli bacterium]|nr:hypothetical protein [Bacilli bacterium]
MPSIKASNPERSLAKPSVNLIKNLSSIKSLYIDCKEALTLFYAASQD